MNHIAALWLAALIFAHLMFPRRSATITDAAAAMFVIAFWGGLWATDRTGSISVSAGYGVLHVCIVLASVAATQWLRILHRVEAAPSALRVAARVVIWTAAIPTMVLISFGYFLAKTEPQFHI